MGDDSRPTRSGFEMWRGQLRVWIARLLVDAPRDSFFDHAPSIMGLRYFLSDHDTAIEPCSIDECVTAILDSARAILATVESSRSNVEKGETLLDRNLGELARRLGLNPVHVGLLRLRVLARVEKDFDLALRISLDDAIDWVLQQRLAQMLGVEFEAVVEALQPSSPLITSRLLIFRRGTVRPLYERLQILSGLIGALLEPVSDGTSMMRSLLPPRRCGQLTLGDYPHHATEITVLRDHLAHALRSGLAGANVLLHGEPGVGKTELVLALGNALDCPVYAMPAAFPDEEVLSAKERLHHLTAMQRLIRCEGSALVLFDEVEDIFPGPYAKLDTSPNKAAINEALETNPVPTVWVCNAIDHLDRAYLRRFDVVLQLRPPPYSVRRRAINLAFGARLPLADSDALAARRHLNPSVLARMARVALAPNAEGTETDPAPRVEVLTRLYLETLEPRERSVPGHGLLPHDAELLHTDPPLDTLMTGLVRESRGRLLCYGLPGTGKTALAASLARRLDRPLHAHAASSLLSPYVGMTERNLCEAFDTAQREGAVLLLDEVDSFLARRENAHANWEATQVNEMLQQLERFEGIVIATTNRKDHLDRAALRRFDLKVSFLPLRPDQRLRLVKAMAAVLAMPWDEAMAPDVARRLDRMDGLNPGHAEAALRRLRLMASAPAVEVMLAALEDELIDVERRRPIGFTAVVA